MIELPKKAVSKKILDNGLVILAKECPGRDIVAVDVKVMAGSGVGTGYPASGISHLVEHMLFKGTKDRKPGDIEKEIKSYGGIINGAVSRDLTSYHIILPAAYLRQALVLLKDILTNASFDEIEFNKEKEVILNELRMNLDNPDAQLARLLNEIAYIRHPYRYPPIGYEALFRRLTREDAVKYYKDMYTPNNMVVSIVGGVKTGEALKAAEDIFADFGERRYGIAGLAPVEPRQTAPRFAEKEFEANLAYMAVGFHSTSLFDKDLFAMDVLAMILGRGESSRLSKSLLKNRRLVYSIACWNHTPKDPGLFVITTVMDKEKIVEARKAIWEEISKIKSGKIDEYELEKAKRTVIADHIFASENIEREADDLATNYILTGSCVFDAQYVDSVQKVTGEDIRRVASDYLTEENSTVAVLLPKGYVIPQGWAAAAPKLAQDKGRKEVLPNGLRVIARTNNDTPVVSITAVMAGGLARETNEDNGISNLTARMLLKGAGKRSEEDIADLVEGMGGTIKSFSGFDGLGINIEVLKPDIDTALSLLKDVLTAPTFPDEQLEKERSIVLAMIVKDDDDIYNTGFNRARRELFKGSPYGLRILGEAESVKSIRRNDVVNFYDRSFAPESVVISVSGDIDAEKVFEKAKVLFAGIKKRAVTEALPKVFKADKAKTITVYMDKAESFVVLGFQTVSIEDKNRYALEVLGSVLSGSSGRLFSRMRGKLSLAYVLGYIEKALKGAGFSAIYIATSKEKLDEAGKVLREEIDNIRKSPPSDDELAMAKRELETNREIAMQANSFFSQNSAIDELYGLGWQNIYSYKVGIDRVTQDDIRKAAETYFDLARCIEVIITQR